MAYSNLLRINHNGQDVVPEIALEGGGKVFYQVSGWKYSDPRASDYKKAAARLLGDCSYTVFYDGVAVCGAIKH